MSRTTTMHRMALDLSLDRALVPVGAGTGERLLPDPEWPVPPRGWHLWAAALPESRGARPSSREEALAADVDRSDVDLTGDDETRPFVEADDAAFTLPSRPALAPRDTVDLLARPRGRRLPEGSGLGFTLMAALVVLGTLIGGPTGGLVVLGVSTLLATSAAIILGRLTLNHVGGLRGGSLLLVVAVGALIVGSVDAAARREDAVQHGVPVPVSSPIASAHPSTPTASASGPASVAPGAPHRTSTELSVVPSVTGTLVPPSPHRAVGSTAPSPQPSATARTAEVVRAAATPTAPLLPTDAFAPKPGLDGLAAVTGTGLRPAEPVGGAVPAQPLQPATHQPAKAPKPAKTLKPAKRLKPAKTLKPAKHAAKQASKQASKQAATDAKAQAKAATTAAKAATTAAKAARKSAAKAARASR